MEVKNIEGKIFDCLDVIHEHPVNLTITWMEII